MRIVCEKCNAPYAIEDRLVTPRGVKAMCPRCRHQQLVKRDPATGSSPAATSGPPLPTVTSGAPPPRSGAFPSASAAPNPPRTGAFPQPGAAPTSVPPPPAITPAQVPRPAIATHRGSAFARAEALIDDALLSPAPAPAQTGPACASCGKPLTDPFDQALGTCDDCRQKTQSGRVSDLPLELQTAPPPTPTVAKLPRPEQRAEPTRGAPAPSDRAKAASPSGMSVGEVDLSANSMRGGGLLDEVPPAEDGSGELALDLDRGGPQTPAGSFDAPAPERKPKTGPRPVATGAPMRTSAARATAEGNGHRGASGRRWVWPALAGVVALGAGGFFAWKLRSHDEGPQVPAAVQAVLPRWRMSFVDLSGSAETFLDQGDHRLSLDEPDGYTEAEEAYQKALLQDPTSVRAVIGYVRAAALGRGKDMEDAQFQEALGLIQAIESRTHAPMAQVAHAELLLTRSTPDALQQARALAQQATSTADPAERAEAEVVQGRAYLSTSASLALESLDRALQIDPQLRRVYLPRAQAHDITGQPAAAIADLRTRLKVDPGQPQAVDMLVRLLVEVGAVDEAKQVIRTAQGGADDLASTVRLAAVAYQVEGKTGAAVSALRQALKAAKNPDQDAQVEGYVHLAAASRLSGDLEGAAAAAEQALKVEPDDAAAHLQLFLLGLQRGRPQDAAKHIQALQSADLDPALAKLLQGRLLFAQGRYADAQEAFTAAAEQDPRRVDALLAAGAAAARAGNADAALASLVKASQLDPERLGPRPVLTEAYLRPGETLEGAEGSIPKLAKGPEDVAPHSYEALLRIHQHDFAGAEREVKQVLSTDENNALGHSLRSLVLLGKGDKAGARAEAELAVANGRQLAIAHEALGLATASGKDAETASRELRTASQMAPDMLSASLHLAEQEAAAGNIDGAQPILAHLLSLDPSYVEAKRLLYALEVKPQGAPKPGAQSNAQSNGAGQ